MFFPQAGVELNPLVLILIGFATGVSSAFFGVGGAFMVTPALNLLGLPMSYAIGTDLAHITGKSVVSTLKHRLLGNVDFKLGLAMVPGTVLGVEGGKTIALRLDNVGHLDAVARYMYFFLLAGIGLFILWEIRGSRGRKGSRSVPTRRYDRLARAVRIPPMVSFPRSKLGPVSLWLVLLLGLVTGLLAGFLGVGGGFIRVPALIYLLGIPTLVAVGTDLFEIIISSAYGTLTYAMANRVDVQVALIMLLGSGVGAHIGAACTSYVYGTKVRLFFALLVLATAASVLLKQLSVSSGVRPWGDAAMYLIVVAAVLACAVIMLAALRGLRAARRAAELPQLPEHQPNPEA